MLMRPVFDIAKKDKRRIVFAEGEDQRVLYSVQLLTEEHRCKPILIGRPDVIAFRIEKAGLSIVPKRDFEIVNPNSDSRFAQYWQSYYGLGQSQRRLTLSGPNHRSFPIQLSLLPSWFTAGKPKA